MVSSCSKDDEATGTDTNLFDLAKETNGFVWYKNSDVFLPRSSGSGHNYSKLRTRFNSIAAGQLDASGKVLPNAIFPEGSVIVKELSNGNSVERYAVLYKNSQLADADSKGWVWGYINASGSVAISSSEKGSSCSGCHSQNGSIDYTLMNKFFP